MNQSRREFLRGAIGWGGLLLAGSLELLAARSAESLRRAQRYLAARQSADGAWRSGRYAAFRDGDVLTPIVLWAMQASSLAGEGGEAYGRGLAWLRQFSDTVTASTDAGTAPHYPLFTASYAAQVFARSGDATHAAVWADRLEQLRTNSALGWPAEDPMCGAWSDAATPPHYVTPVPDMLAPNISATALALNALAACGQSSTTALPFIAHCQNFAEGKATTFEDGGFFFALDDPIRNKAGVAGRDGRGRQRFRSYGSTTCDGYLALRACGLSHEHPRVQAAANWLQEHSTGLTHGGQWETSREEARASLTFYQGQALAAVLADQPRASGRTLRLRESISAELAARQDREGAWQGRAPDSCEDEPLLATAFALRTLALMS